MNTEIKAIEWKDNCLYLIDQRYIPKKESWKKITSIEECHDAIKSMVVRGAPLIGLTAIYGMALWLKSNLSKKVDEKFIKMYQKIGDYLSTSRPTAVNLDYEKNQCLAIAKDNNYLNCGVDKLYQATLKYASDQLRLTRARNLKMAELAEKELTKLYGNKKLNIMTICNTGALACGPIGTALGVITELHKKNRINNVWVNETRPYNQGIRLTSYELIKQNVPHQIVVESASSFLMDRKKVDAIFVGADRIVSNGDTANKVGTGTISIVAKEYGVPFFVVAPISSFDLEKKSGREIEIELRDENEILVLAGEKIAPDNAKAFNPSFDIAYSKNISGIICEKGMISPVNSENLKSILRG